LKTVNDKGDSAEPIVELLKEIDNWMLNAVDILGFVESHYHGEMADEATLLKWQKGKMRDRILREINANDNQQVPLSDSSAG
jgi:hypothetical protein